MRKHPKGYEHIKTVRFSPYRKGCGPSFTLHLYETNMPGHRWDGRDRLAYIFLEGREIIFEGDDFCASLCHAIDSMETVRALMGFLTLRPGDTDSEYFDEYTERQMRFCDEHAEALGVECQYKLRYGRTR